MRAFGLLALLFWGCCAAAETPNDAVAAYGRQDYARAAPLFRAAADEGDARSAAFLGRMYEYGQGLPKDEVEATRWYRVAAERGHRGAQSILGARYYNGLGAPRDAVQARLWLGRAAAQGDPFALRILSGRNAVPRGRRITASYGELVAAARWGLSGQGGIGGFGIVLLIMIGISALAAILLAFLIIASRGLLNRFRRDTLGHRSLDGWAAAETVALLVATPFLAVTLFRGAPGLAMPFALGLVLVWGYARIIAPNRRRSQELLDAAARESLVAAPDAETVLQELRPYTLSTGAREGRPRAVLAPRRAVVDGIEVTAFDFTRGEYWRGSVVEHRYTAALLRSPRPLPDFRIEATPLVLFKAGGFLRDYTLAAKQHELVRGALRPELIAFLSSSTGWNLESLGGRVLIHREIVPVDRIPEFLQECGELARLL